MNQAEIVANLPGMGVELVGHPLDDGPAIKGAIVSVSERTIGVTVAIVLEDGRRFPAVSLHRINVGECVSGTNQFTLTGPLHGAPYLAQLAAAETLRNASETAAKAQADEAKAQALAAVRAEFPFLSVLDQKYDDNGAAKNIRALLKARFPGVKFSVRQSRGSGTSAVNIKWEDGPTAQQVSSEVNRFSAGHFDGMTDSYEYQSSAFTDAFGSFRYVFTDRSNSPRAIESAIRTLRTRYASLADVVINVDEFERGAYWNTPVSGSCDELGPLICKTAARRTWCMTKTK